MRTFRNMGLAALAFTTLFACNLPARAQDAPATPAAGAQAPAADPGAAPRPRPRRQAQPQNRQAQMLGVLLDLDLTADQWSKVGPILADAQKQNKALAADTNLDQTERTAKTREIQRSTMTKLNEVLTDDQRTKAMAGLRRGGRNGRRGGAAGAPAAAGTTTTTTTTVTPK